jgi:zona occludens toxin
MLTLITGAPGAGKTAALVLLLQDTLATSGRQIYVHGIPDLKIPHEVLEHPETWPTTVPDGAIIIIDEVQNVWRPRGPGQKVPDHVQALETHRHRGLDFYIITQGPNLVDSNVRALIGRHIHLRDIGFMGRWWYEWPECADQCRTTWKNAPIKKKYQLPKKIFGQYKSSSLHVKPIRSFPKMFFVAIAALIGVVFLAWRAYGSVTSKMAPTPVLTQPGTISKPLGSSFTSSGPPDERKDFNSRVPGRPWTAPAYDALRVVVTMPVITGAICVGPVCKCYHHNRVIPTVSNGECFAWASAPPFNPYTVPDTSAPSRSEHVSTSTSPTSTPQNSPKS